MFYVQLHLNRTYAYNAYREVHMPRDTVKQLVEKLRFDIAQNHSPGDKYKTIREIASVYEVSIQSAQKAMQVLKKDNIVELKPKAGARILNTSPSNSVEGSTVGVFSSLNDPIYDQTFISVIEKRLSDLGISMAFHHLDETRFKGLELGFHVQSMDVDAAIFLSYVNSQLSFYHLHRDGFPFVSDISYDELTMIPTVQTNNFIHAYEAGQRQLRAGYTSFVMIGYQSISESSRYKGFLEGVEGNENEIDYIQLNDARSFAHLSNAIHYLEKDSSVFCADYPLIDMVASKFLQYNIPADNDKLLIYDCAENGYDFNGLPTIHSVAPGIKTIGARLCDVLTDMMKTGAPPFPSKVFI